MAANRLNIRHLGRFDLTFDDCTAAALAAWLLVVTLPIAFVQGSSSRMIALIAILPVGLGRLIQATRRSRGWCYPESIPVR